MVRSTPSTPSTSHLPYRHERTPSPSPPLPSPARSIAHPAQQAQACGATFARTPLAAIYASPLDRAHTTARAIHATQPQPQPPLVLAPDLREQHFGIAEGHSWLARDGNPKVKVFPALSGRDDKFPGAESLNDLRRRAERALDELILPWLGGPAGDVHLAVVSHGVYRRGRPGRV